MTSRLSHMDMGLPRSINPDMMTLGKWVGGGMSFGAFGGQENIMRLYDPRTGGLEHPGTFNNNVLSMSAGIAGCGLLTQDLLGKLNHEGALMTLKIDTVIKKHTLKGMKPATPIVNEDVLLKSGAPPKMFITGAGSLMNIHFFGPEKQLLQGLFWHHMLQHGIYLAQRGFISLSIVIGPSEINSFVNAVESFCQAWHEYLTNS